METGNNFDYESFKAEAIQGLSEGKKWGGAGISGRLPKRDQRAGSRGHRHRP